MKVGEWIATPYGGASTDSVWLAITPEEEPGDDQWSPAFYEDGFVLIRAPEVPPGTYWLWMKTGTTPLERVDTIKVTA